MLVTFMVWHQIFQGVTLKQLLQFYRFFRCLINYISFALFPLSLTGPYWVCLQNGDRLIYKPHIFPNVHKPNCPGLIFIPLASPVLTNRVKNYFCYNIFLRLPIKGGRDYDIQYLLRNYKYYTSRLQSTNLELHQYISDKINIKINSISQPININTFVGVSSTQLTYKRTMFVLIEIFSWGFGWEIEFKTKIETNLI